MPVGVQISLRYSNIKRVRLASPQYPVAHPGHQQLSCWTWHSWPESSHNHTSRRISCDVHWCAGTTFPIRDYLGLWHGYIITNLITVGRKYSFMYNKTAIEHGWVITRYCLLWMHFVTYAKPGFSKVNLNPTHHNGCNYLSMLELRLLHVNKRGYCCTYLICFVAAWHMLFYTTESFYTYISLKFHLLCGPYCAARKGPFLSPISVTKGLFFARIP